MAQPDLQLENFSDKIWSAADILRGAFHEDDYGTIILPFALLRRIECALAPTREAAVKQYEIAQKMNFLTEKQYENIIKRVTNTPFFNVTLMTLGTVGATNTRADMQTYIEGFSKNVYDIFAKMNLINVCDQLQEAGLLYEIVKFFNKLDLSPEAVPMRVMSNIYEELIWRFASSKHKQSKEFLTPRDVVRLATTLVLESDGDIIASDNGQIRTLYDPTCGTAGFALDGASLIYEYAKQSGAKNPPMIVPYGQEIAPIAWAMGKTMMLFYSMSQVSENGEIPVDFSQNYLLGNTLTKDLLIDEATGEPMKFDYVFSNPPFGMDWSKSYDDVAKDPRFATVGLPPKSDGSMLFLTHVAKKLADKGHGAIVLSGSPLFTGGAGSGASEIRRWLFEKDFVEAIVQLPNDLFYNTSIGTYLWLLNKDKPKHKKHKIQLINASDRKTPIKNVGKKRFIISDDDIAVIAREVADFENSETSRICNYKEFGYRAVTIQRPLKVKIIVTTDGINKLLSHKALAKLNSENRQTIRDRLEKVVGQEKKFVWISVFIDDMKCLKIKLGKPVQKAMLDIFGVPNPDGDAIKDVKGNIVFDPSSKQIENVPLTGSLHAYMQSEVLPFVSDAIVDRSVTDSEDNEVGIVGYEVNFNKYFYKYVAPRDPEVIATELIAIEEETNRLIKELFA